ncbi:MAG: hypothetical protein RSC16_10595 [Enterococcus sp.]|uniref:hypothetical protein n=1 Tax=Enterococcus sp. TaxID=35783 RepID=UPI002FC73A65
MRKDFEYNQTVSIEFAKKIATFKTTKAIFLGGIIGVTCAGYWPVALLLIPVSFVVNKVVKKVLGL